MIYLNAIVIFFQDLFVKTRTFMPVGHSFPFHPLFSGSLTTVLQLKLLMLKEVNTFLQCPGKKVNAQRAAGTSRKKRLFTWWISWVLCMGWKTSNTGTPVQTGYLCCCIFSLLGLFLDTLISVLVWLVSGCAVKE